MGECRADDRPLALTAQLELAELAVQRSYLEILEPNNPENPGQLLRSIHC